MEDDKIYVTINRIQAMSSALRSMDIYSDQKVLGSIRNGKKKQFFIPKNTKYLYLKEYWSKSKKYIISHKQVEINDGMLTLYIVPEGTLNPLRALGITSMPFVLTDVYPY